MFVCTHMYIQQTLALLKQNVYSFTIVLNEWSRHDYTHVRLMLSCSMCRTRRIMDQCSAPKAECGTLRFDPSVTVHPFNNSGDLPH